MANTFSIGEMSVTVISDGYAKFPPNLYYRDTTPEQWEPHKRWLDHDGNIEFPFACFLVRTGGRTLLIDTGLGWLKMYTFTGGALLDELAAAGVRPEDIDTVFVTHLHIDHCGNCTVNDGKVQRPAFPNATYRWSSKEQEFWKGVTTIPANEDFSFPGWMDVLGSRIETADEGDNIAEGISIIATPGHTPGHSGVILSSGTERAFLLGDAISCPAQLEEPEWSGLGDMDAKLARQSQEVVAREIEESGALLATGHFPGLTFGRVLRGEGRRYWEPVVT